MQGRSALARARAAEMTPRKRLFNRPSKQVASFAMIQPNRSKMSSAALHTIADGVQPANVLDGWATDAYTFADEIGEVGFVVGLSATAGAQCDFRVEQFDPLDKLWKRSADDRPQRVMDAFVGPQGGQAELIRKGFLHLNIAGEGILLGTPTEELGVSTGLVWEFLSSQEVIIPRSGPPKRKADGVTAEELADDTYVARMWRSHPRFSKLSDSQLRRVLSICREITTLSQMVEAIARSRLSAGILFVPDEMELPTADTEADGSDDGADDDQGLGQFIELLEGHLKAPVEDRSSAASLVPLIIRGPSALKDSIGLIDISRNLDTWAQELRQESLNRLASGLDIDPSVIKGAGTLTHWNLFAIDSGFITKHVRPTGELIADFVTVAYLRPMLEEFEGCDSNTSLMFRLAFDPSAIMARTDEAASSRVLHDMDILSDTTLVRANGFDETDLPTPEEIRRRLARKMMLAWPGFAPALAELAGLPGVDWSKAITVAKNTGQVGTDNPTNQPSDWNPTDATSGMHEPPPPSFGTLVMQLATAADFAVERAFEVAGGRLISKAGKTPQIRDRFTTVPKGRVCEQVAPKDLADLGLSPSSLFHEAWSSFATRARSFVCTHLEASGKSHLIADDLAALAASNLCNALDAYATETLHRGRPVHANGMSVPDQLVAEALLSAGVG